MANWSRIAWRQQENNAHSDNENLPNNLLVLGIHTALSSAYCTLNYAGTYRYARS